ncbi:hypothetical protein TrLO_g8100 [Triparma laevis f. longispina]|uniref:Thioredoxin domain-containing protein n=1 Tax=Triparma laevis f. longispina TaxID=1714387 RepID=A0A9W7A6U4_9STRA|nr:hypothetical protein TrLO_g8100 [Triparma laevis f. longispina]
MFMLRNYFQSQQPFPTVDYGHVSTVVSKADFDKVTRQQVEKEGAPDHRLTIVDFYATWCPPCKAAVPLYAKMSEDYYKKGVQFYKCDVDKSRDTSSSQGISAMPTFKVYKGGICVETVKGLSEANIRAALDKALVETSVGGAQTKK